MEDREVGGDPGAGKGVLVCIFAGRRGLIPSLTVPRRCRALEGLSVLCGHYSSAGSERVHVFCGRSAYGDGGYHLKIRNLFFCFPECSVLHLPPGFLYDPSEGWKASPLRNRGEFLISPAEREA